MNFKLRRLLIVVLITLFSLLAEYSVRGLNHFVENPALALVLFINYFPYFLILEDTIGRFQLKDSQLYSLAFAFAVLWQLLGTAVTFLPPKVFGFNLFGLIFNNFVWWPALQTLLPFYFANRIVPRKGSGPLLPKWGVVIAFVIFVLVTLGYRLFVKGFPVPTLWQVSVMMTMIVVSAVIFFKSIDGEGKIAAVSACDPCPDRVIDMTCIALLMYLVYLAVFRIDDPTVVGVARLNATSLRNLVIVSALASAIVGVRRWKTKKPIPI